MYYMNEGTLTLPFDYTDHSITILKFPAEKSSLTIVRGEMPAELSLSASVELQRNLFRREFKTVVLGDPESVRLGSSPSSEATEFFCLFDKAGIRQYQMNLLMKHGASFITFSYTQLRAFTSEDLSHWAAIKSDFVIDPRWFQTLTGAGHE
ncbi:DcrB-related protein [Erwinia sorbitola]|uniref:DUF1795 domain-containing protein n=1 Tax=Erwinia sorbitola TaxID=2681984 RepID=A0A6I6EPD7_9GAMM|nr:DcrB-related protein [Erwinia sorbitola]MTD28647.1 DUF1795 domain-containing protein [Erwinia sorbitola]QGU88106.1 DUF1795 domain-containing protein [Erwinia sorbitola]